MIPGSASPLLLKSAAAAGPVQIERSLRFNSSDSGFCSRTPGTASNRKTWTWAAWVKRTVKNTATDQMLFTGGTTNSDTGFLALDFNSSDKLRLSSAATNFLISTAVYRDPGAWMHIVLAFDATQGTNANKVKLYVNSTEVTVFDTDGRSSISNQDYGVNQAAAHEIGRASLGSNKYLDGYLADVHFIDGQALTPSSFTEVSATTGQLIPKAYSGGSYGTNGFYLQFADNSSNTATTLGKDTSGNSNNWTPNNLSTTTGGPTSVAAASGALPVFNTTDTYGTVKGTGTRTDTNSASIVLAVPMDGTNGGTSFGDQSAVIRGSGSAKTVTVNGNTNTSTAQSKFYGSSGYFDGTGDWLETPHSADFTLSRSASTMECWVYPTNLSSQRIVLDKSNSGGANQSYTVRINTNGTVLVEWIYPSLSAASLTSALTVSTNIWSHISVVTSSNTLYVYVNGIRDANTTALSNDAQSTTSTPFRIGSTYNSSNQFLGYIQDVRVYTTAKYTGNFNPPSSTANATIAAGNDSLVDTPTSYGTPDTGVGNEVRGNYATLNPLISGTGTLSNGNLDFTTAIPNNIWAYGTIKIVSGKWYWEVSPTSNSANTGIGIDSSVTFANYFYILGNGKKRSVAGGDQTYGSAIAVNDVIGVALDADANTLTFYINGVSQGIAFSGLTDDYFPLIVLDAYGPGNIAYTANFGQRAFAYTAPSGFKALCDTNIPEGTITTSGTYTGNGVADGPVVYLNGIPTAMTIGVNAVTFGTHADKLSNGFKLRTTNILYNQNALSYSYSITATGAKFKYARAQPNP